jgi:hypothetical protein
VKRDEVRHEKKSPLSAEAMLESPPPDNASREMSYATKEYIIGTFLLAVVTGSFAVAILGGY